MKSLLSICLLLLLMAGPGASMAGPVNINTADAATLAAELDGVGPAIAEEIVKDRGENGPFDTAESLMRVRGVGPRIVEANRDNILTSREPATN